MSEKRKIAIVGDVNTAIGFKLAGLKRVYEMEDTVEDEKLNKLLTELQSDPMIGIIVLTDNFTTRVKNLTRSSAGFPIMVTIPKLQKPQFFPDVKKYYREQITNVLGFSIELKNSVKE